MGCIWFHSPDFGLLKSGMPDSVLIPAPVKNTGRSLALMASAKIPMMFVSLGRSPK